MAYLKSLIEGFLNSQVKLSRAKGLGQFILKNSQSLPNSLKEDLKRFDLLPLNKKRAILKEVLKLLDQKVEEKNLKDFLRPIEEEDLTRAEVKVLKDLGIDRVLDALYYFPTKYEDRRVLNSIKLAKVGEKVALLLRLKSIEKVEGDYNYEVICTDGRNFISLMYKYKDFRAMLRFKQLKEFVAFGKLKVYGDRYYMVHPKIFKKDSPQINKIVPLYNVRGVEGQVPSELKQRRIREAIGKLVGKYWQGFPETLPAWILEKYQFPKASEAFRMLHKPTTMDLKIYQKRFIYEDLLLFSLALLIRRENISSRPAPKVESCKKIYRDFVRALPFSLTHSQRRAMEEIIKDLEKGKVMMRLLQGDVGSGKTVVALFASLCLIRSGYQVAFMVPTEILAHQHFKTAKEILKPFGVEVALLTGSTSTLERMKIYRLCQSGHLKLLIGTHSLIEEKVKFKNLGLVVIDEQHRFGVLQRKSLIEKGFPHLLVMSATPIPRTLALALYGDLEVSQLRELPFKRKVKSFLFYEDEFDKVIELVREKLKEGGKGFVVYPLIEESERLNLRSAIYEYNKWKEIFKDKKVLLLHGRMKESQKREVLEEFIREGHILVSTSVIEVGLDVPRANFMVVESAQRFGLSQLHQLRGRVGRGGEEAYCILVVPREVEGSEETLKRLRVFLTTEDGFKLSYEDLKLRGAGELLGISQKGFFNFSLANLDEPSHRNILIYAREDARRLIREGLPEKLKELLKVRFGERLELSTVY